MVDWRALLRRLLTEEFELFVAVLVLLVGLFVGFVVARLIRRLLVAFSVPETVEGTPFERTAQRLGTSTVSLLAQLGGLFVVVVAALLSLRIARIITAQLFITRIAAFLPQLFVAVVIVIVGLIAGEKAQVAISERLRSVKLPEVGLVPTLAKYTIFYVAALIALSQLKVATGALLVLLLAYAFGIVFLGGLALKDLLAASAAGIYLLLAEPYSIGDEVEIDGNRGIVQEVDVFVTRIENEGEEFIVPNHRAFRSGIVRVVD